MDPIQHAMDTGDSAKSGRLKVDAGRSHKGHRAKSGKKCLICAINKSPRLKK